MASGATVLAEAIKAKQARLRALGLGAPAQRPGFVFLPEVPDPRISTKPAGRSPSKRDSKVSPAGGVVPLLYGRRRVPGLFVYLKVISNVMHGVWVFAKGELHACEALYLNGTEVSTYGSAVSVELYTGTSGQSVCGLSAYDASWTDALAGIAYAYIRLRATANIQDLPRVEAVWQGKKLYDHRSGSTAYSTNPALAIADILTDTGDGGKVASASMDWDSFDAAADYCDELIGSPAQKRHELNYYFAAESTLAGVIETMRRHCLGAVSVGSSGVYRLDIAQPRAVAASFEESEVWDVTVPQLNSADLVNSVHWTWTDPATWEEVTESLEDPTLGANDEVHERTYDFTGSLSLSHSTRLATYMLNSRLSDLRVSFATYNYKGLQPGDVFELTHSLGLTAKKLSCVSVQPQADGSHVIEGWEYDPACYSDSLQTEPTYADTTLPDPTATPDDVSHLAVVEALGQLADRTLISVLRVSWTAPDFPFIGHYEVWVSEAGGDYVLIATTMGSQHEMRTVRENVLHTFKVVTVSRWGNRSAGATVAITPQGKVIPPSWKAGAALTGTEAGDVVFLSWAMADGAGPAEDVDALEYEIRRAGTGSTWDNALFVARGFFLVFQDRGCPAGTWRYFLKARDSVGNYTADHKYADVTVTLNPNLGSNADKYMTFAGASCTSVIVFGAAGSQSACPITSSYDTLSERFPGSEFDDAEVHASLSHPANTSGSNFTTAAYDLGAVMSGLFTLNVTVTKLGSGTSDVSYDILLSLDDVTYSTNAAGAASTGATGVNGTARYVKVKFTFTSADADNSRVVSEPCYVTLKSDIKGEHGTVTTSSGTKSITFVNTYNTIQKVRLTAKSGGSSYDPITAVYDSLTTSGMTIKLFDKNNAAYDGEVRYEVEGT